MLSPVPHPATVQISLDLIDMNEALDTAALAVRAGVDWLEAGTPLILAEGMRAIRELRAHFPETPIVADLKITDGGWLEAEMAIKAGANMVVVMGQAHEETIALVAKACRDLGAKAMGDNMNMPDPVKGAQILESLGCDYVIHHIGYDMRTLRRQRGLPVPTPLHRLREVVQAVKVPVQAVGGLTIEQAIETPTYGAPLVVIGAPLAIDAYAFRSVKASTGRDSAPPNKGGTSADLGADRESVVLRSSTEDDLEETLRHICQRIHAADVTAPRN